MANWCINDIVIYSEKKEELKKLFDLLNKTDELRVFGGYRGEIIYLDYYKDEIIITAESAWTSCIRLFDNLSKQYLGEDYCLTYRAYESGNDYWVTNDEDLDGTYYYCDEEDEESFDVDGKWLTEHLIKNYNLSSTNFEEQRKELSKKGVNVVLGKWVWLDVGDVD